MADEEEVLQIPVGAGIGQTGQVTLLGHRRLHGGVIRLGGDGAEDHRHGPVASQLQGHIQGQPGGQGGLLGLQLALLGGEGGQLPLSIHNRLGRFQSLTVEIGVKQLLLGELGPDAEQPLLGRGVLL